MEKIKSELSDIVGDQNVSSGQDQNVNFAIYGVAPEIITFPSNSDELAEIVKYCSANNLNILPLGNGTKLTLGNKPKHLDVGISTKNLNKIIEHSESDFIISAQAGVTLLELKDYIRNTNQFFPLDPPFLNSGATLGGVASANDSGPSRLKYGTFRELILEIKVVNINGETIRGGAKVVKNVAGYDLPKLFVGSLGTLGIITECTVRLYPVPEFSKTYVSGFSSIEELKKAVSDLLDADLVLTCLEIANSNLSVEIFKQAGLRPILFPYTLMVKVDNVKQAVNDQINAIERILMKKGVEGAVIEKDNNIWDHIRNFPYTSNENLVCKASVAITDVYKVLENIYEISENLDVEILTSVRAGNGIIIISISGENKIIAANLLRSSINSIKGRLIITQQPSDVDEEINVWGNLDNSLDIMKTIKTGFDPNNLLNSGRFI